MTTTNLIKCSKCNEETLYEETDDPVEITNQTGFVLVKEGWLCPDCVDDHFHNEGC